MLDHIGLVVSDYEISKQFYIKALEPLDYVLQIEVQGYAGFKHRHGSGAIAQLWMHQETVAGRPVHVAFTAKDRKIVDAFYEAALFAGGKDNGAPGIREMYHQNYYGAFILDPDGNNIEAVCHEAC